MPYFFKCLALLLAVAGAMPAVSAIASAVESKVNFIAPENFTDARLGRTSGGADAVVLATIERHLQQLASRCLPAGRSLDIRIHDIDLAGRVEWWRGSSAQTRVMNDVTWPRIKLTYAVQEDGQTGREILRELSNMAYLSESPFLRAESMPLPYERAMLGRWFEQQFCNK